MKKYQTDQESPTSSAPLDATFPNWVYRYAESLGETPQSVLNFTYKLVSFPCSVCRETPVVRTQMSDASVCESCQRRITEHRENHKRNAAQRSKMRVLRQQMAKVGQLLQTAKVLLNENYQ